MRTHLTTDPDVDRDAETKEAWGIGVNLDVNMVIKLHASGDTDRYGN